MFTDVLLLSEQQNEDEKLSETLLLSVAAIAQRYMRLPSSNSKVADAFVITCFSPISVIQLTSFDIYPLSLDWKSSTP